MGVESDRVPHIKERIITFMRQYQGRPVTVQEIVENVGISRAQVFNAMTYIIESMHPLVRKVGSGVYVMSQDGEVPGPQITFDIVGDIKGGKLVRNAEGKVFKLTPVE